MDVWVASVAAFGVLGGAVAVAWLLRGKSRFVVERNWHFWVKMVGFCFLLMFWGKDGVVESG